MSQSGTIEFGSKNFQEDLSALRKWDNGSNKPITLFYENTPLSVPVLTVVDMFQTGNLKSFCILERDKIIKAVISMGSKSEKEMREMSRGTTPMKVVHSEGPSLRKKNRHPHDPTSYRQTNMTHKKKRKK